MAKKNSARAALGIAVTTSLIAGIVLASIVASWDCPHSSHFACVPVERQAAVVTIFSLTLAPTVYFAKQMRSDKIEGQRASTALHAELGDALSCLDPGRHPNLRAATIRGRTIHFTSRMFNHDIYDSLVNSGKITFVDVGIQQRVQNIFQEIKDHNMALLKIREMEESGADPSRAEYLYWRLEDAEYKLLDMIPASMSELEERYSIPSSQGRKARGSDRGKACGRARRSQER